MNDDKIVDLYWIRSEDAITETSIKYGKYCYGIAYNILADAEDAEDTADTDTHFAMPELSALLGEPVTDAEQNETPAEDDDDRAE